MVRLTITNDLLLLDSSEADHKSSFGRDDHISFRIDAQVEQKLQPASDMRMKGWYVLGSAISNLKTLARGHGLLLSSADKGHTVSVSLEGMARVNDFFKRCHS